jgi:hypothetical protein
MFYFAFQKKNVRVVNMHSREIATLHRSKMIEHGQNAAA